MTDHKTGPELLAAARLRRATRSMPTPSSSGYVGAVLFARCAGAAAYAMLTDDAESLTVIERLSIGAVERGSMAIGNVLPECHSGAIERAAWCYLSDAIGAPMVAHLASDKSPDDYRGRVLATSVNRSYRECLNRHYADRPRNVDAASSIGQIAEWKPTRRIEHASRYTSGDLSRMPFASAIVAADAILFARAVAGASSVPLVRGRVGRPSVANDPTLDGSLRSSVASAESEYLNLVTAASLNAAMRFTFGTMLPRLWTGYRAPRIAKRDRKREGIRKGDIRRPRSMAWGRVVTGTDATTTRRMVRRMATDALAMARRIEQRGIMASDTYSMRAAVAPDGTRVAVLDVAWHTPSVHHAWQDSLVATLDAAVQDWQPSALDVAAYLTASSKRTRKVLDAIESDRGSKRDLLRMADMAYADAMRTAARVAPYETAGRDYGGDIEIAWSPYAVRCIRCSMPLAAVADDGTMLDGMASDLSAIGQVCRCADKGTDVRDSFGRAIE